MKKIFLTLALIFLFSTETYGSEILTRQLDMLNLDEFSSVIDKTYEGNSIDIKELALNALSGNLDISISGIIRSCLNIFMGEVVSNIALMRNLLVISLLSAILKNFSDSFKNSSIGEISFFAVYSILVLIAFSSFRTACFIASETTEMLSSIISGGMPLITAIVLMSGYTASAYVFNPILMFLANSITFFISDVVLPGIILVASLQIVNYLTEKEMLTRLTELFKSLLTTGLKVLGILFMGVLSLQRITAPIINSAIGKTAKSAINAVPVVGEVFATTVDTYFYWAQAAKSGVIVAVFIGVTLVFAVPIIKIVSLMVMYKLTAAIIQPICDARIVNCLDAIGSFTGLLLSAALTVIIMFLFSLMIILTL